MSIFASDALKLFRLMVEDLRSAGDSPARRGELSERRQRERFWLTALGAPVARTMRQKPVELPAPPKEAVGAPSGAPDGWTWPAVHPAAAEDEADFNAEEHKRWVAEQLAAGLNGAPRPE